MISLMSKENVMYFISNPLFPNHPITHTNNPLTQNKTSLSLPASYLTILTEQNGGYLQFNSLPTTEPTRDGLNSVNFHYLFGIHQEAETSILFQKQYHEKYSLPDYFVFFSVNDEQLWAFDYSTVKNGEPSIRYLDMDTDQWLHIADSFADFLQLLIFEPLDLNEERTLTRHEANHDFLLANPTELNELVLRFESHPDKFWYFSWLIHLAKQADPSLQQLAFSAFETQLLYFHPVLPENAHDLTLILQQSDASIINQKDLSQLLTELN